MKWIFSLAFSLLLSWQVAFATPNKIYIIRHADKLLQQQPGPTLSAQGYLRAILFARYFRGHYSEPDYIFTTNPINAHGKNSSLRELQTVAVLANQLAALHPDSGYPIMHPLASSQYQQLAQTLLHDPKYNNTTILICWNHSVIPQLAQALGVKEKIKAWEKKDFDSVYILNYNDKGELQTFKNLKNQYPVPHAEITWQKLIGNF